MIDGEQYFGCGNVFGGLCRLCMWKAAIIRGEPVCGNIQFRLWRQFIKFSSIVLVSFYPLGLERSSEFFVEISDDREVASQYCLVALLVVGNLC